MSRFRKLFLYGNFRFVGEPLYTRLFRMERRFVLGGEYFKRLVVGIGNNCRFVELRSIYVRE